jgi:hypothetical protein
MNTQEEVKKTVVTEPLKEAIKWLLASSSSFLLLCIPKVYSWLTTHLPFGLLLAIIGIEFLTISVLLSYVFYLRKRLNELVPTFIYKFGIQWDNEQNPFCPKCSNRLGPHTEWLSGWGFECYECKKIYAIRKEDGSGQKISFQQAMKILRDAKQT